MAQQEKHFDISEQCSSDEKAVFKSINKALDVLGSNRDEFDQYFRVALMEQLQNLIGGAEGSLLAHAPDKIRTELLTADSSLQEQQTVHERSKSLLGDSTMDFHMVPDITADEIMHGVKVLRHDADNIRSHFTKEIARKIGAFYAIKPKGKLKQDTQPLVDLFQQEMDADVLKGKQFNLLQNMASGEQPIFDREGTYIPMGIDTEGRLQMETGTFDSYIRNALVQAMRNIVTHKDLDRDKLIPSLQNIEQDINHLMWKIVDGTPLEGRQLIEDTATRTAITDLRKKVSQQVRLEGGTPDERTLFIRALEKVPASIKQTLLATEPTFYLTDDSNSSIENNKIKIGKKALRPDLSTEQRITAVAAHITSSVLAYNVNVESIRHLIDKGIEETANYVIEGKSYANDEEREREKRFLVNEFKSKPIKSQISGMLMGYIAEREFIMSGAGTGHTAPVLEKIYQECNKQLGQHLVKLEDAAKTNGSQRDDEPEFTLNGGTARQQRIFMDTVKKLPNILQAIMREQRMEFTFDESPDSESRLNGNKATFGGRDFRTEAIENDSDEIISAALSAHIHAFTLASKVSQEQVAGFFDEALDEYAEQTASAANIPNIPHENIKDRVKLDVMEHGFANGLAQVLTSTFFDNNVDETRPPKAFEHRIKLLMRCQSETLLTRAAPTLEELQQAVQVTGGNEQNRAVFIEAMNELPDFIKLHLADQKLRFQIQSNTQGFPDVKGKTITLKKGAFDDTQSHEGLKDRIKAHIVGYTLASVVPQAEVTNVYNHAKQEHVARVASESGALQSMPQQMQESMLALQENQLNNLGFKSAAGQILTGYLMDALGEPNSRGANAITAMQNRTELYKACEQIAEARALRVTSTGQSTQNSLDSAAKERASDKGIPVEELKEMVALEGGTTEQQQQFWEAMQHVPGRLKDILAETKPTFHLDNSTNINRVKENGMHLGAKDASAENFETAIVATTIAANIDTTSLTVDLEKAVEDQCKFSVINKNMRPDEKRRRIKRNLKTKLQENVETQIAGVLGLYFQQTSFGSDANQQLLNKKCSNVKALYTECTAALEPKVSKGSEQGADNQHSVVLHGGNHEQRTAFYSAVKEFPLQWKDVIQNQSLEFVIDDNVKSTTIDGNTVTFSAKVFDNDTAKLKAAISSQVAAGVMACAIDEEPFIKAYGDIYDLALVEHTQHLLRVNGRGHIVDSSAVEVEEVAIGEAAEKGFKTSLAQILANRLYASAMGTPADHNALKYGGQLNALCQTWVQTPPPQLNASEIASETYYPKLEGTSDERFQKVFKEAYAGLSDEEKNLIKVRGISFKYHDLDIYGTAEGLRKEYIKYLGTYKPTKNTIVFNTNEMVNALAGSASDEITAAIRGRLMNLICDIDISTDEMDSIRRQNTNTLTAGVLQKGRVGTIGSEDLAKLNKGNIPTKYKRDADKIRREVKVTTESYSDQAAIENLLTGIHVNTLSNKKSSYEKKAWAVYERYQKAYEKQLANPQQAQAANDNAQNAAEAPTLEGASEEDPQQSASAYAVLDEDKKAAQEKAAKELERARKEKEAEKQSKPYPIESLALPKKGINKSVQDELEAICGALDCRDGKQQQLGDALFKNGVGALMVALVGNTPGNINKALKAIKGDVTVGKSFKEARDKVWNIIHVNPDSAMDQSARNALQNLQQKIKQHKLGEKILWTQELLEDDGHGICARDNLAAMECTLYNLDLAKKVKADEDLTQTIEEYKHQLEVLESRKEALEVLQHTLYESPIIMAALTGKEKLIDEAKIISGDSGDKELVELFMNDEVMPLFDPDHVPEMPAPKQDESTLPPSADDTADPVSPETTDEVDVEPEQPEKTIPPGAPIAGGATAAGIIAAGSTDDPKTPPPAADEPEEPAIVEDVEPARNPAKLRAEAMQEAEEKLIAAANLMVLRNVDEGRTEFKCDLGSLQNNTFPIRFSFVNKEDQTNEQKIEYRDYANCFTGRNIPPPTLGEAVALKIAVQSHILNSEDIEPYRARATGGSRAVLIDNAMPLNAHRPEACSIRVNGSSGTNSLEIRSSDRDNGDEVKVSIALGLRTSDDNPFTGEEKKWVQHKVDRPEEISETADRVKHVMEFIEEHGRERRIVNKREVVDDLKEYVEEQGKQWEYGEVVNLPGFDDSQIIHQVTNESGSILQQIELGTVNLYRKGDVNPYWEAKVTTRLRDYTQPDDHNPHFKGFVVNLHTDDVNLAMARATETLLTGTLLPGDKMGTPSFLDQVRDYIREHPNDMWTTDGHGRNSRIGDKLYTEFRDDAPRYEDDIQVKMSEPEKLEKSTRITLEVSRANRQARRSGVAASPEAFHFKLNERRTPLSVTLDLPTTDIAAVKRFADKINSSVALDLGDAYAAFALNDDTVEEERKTVQGYDPQTIVNHFFGAIKTQLSVDFGVNNLESVLGTHEQGSVEAQLLHYQNSNGNGGGRRNGNGNNYGTHHRIDHRQQAMGQDVRPYDEVLNPDMHSNQYWERQL